MSGTQRVFKTYYIHNKNSLKALFICHFRSIIFCLTLKFHEIDVIIKMTFHCKTEAVYLYTQTITYQMITTVLKFAENQNSHPHAYRIYL